MAGLSWLERKAAAALFATPPEATYDETLQSFMRAEELNPGAWKGNILMIAKVSTGAPNSQFSVFIIISVCFFRIRPFVANGDGHNV